MTYRFHPGAEDDLVAALDFYRREAGRAVAARFVDEVERAAQLIAENPGIGSPTSSGRRCLPLRSFPYSLIYRPTDQSPLILVLRHQHREPTHGQNRA
jgi:plasmid stabilization system protein ParE